MQEPYGDVARICEMRVQKVYKAEVKRNISSVWVHCPLPTPRRTMSWIRPTEKFIPFLHLGTCSSRQFQCWPKARKRGHSGKTAGSTHPANPYYNGRGSIGKIKKTIDELETIPADLMTGLEKRETILSETEEDPYGLSLKRGPGTRNEPNLVTSAFSKRMIGCICPDDDSLNINYMWLHMGEPKRCGCGFWFKLVAKDPTFPYLLIFKQGFSGGGPHGCNIFSIKLNLTLALASFSLIAKKFKRSKCPIYEANESLCWFTSHSNFVVSAWPVPMYLDCKCSS
ncbi:hypothetical protein C0J52_20714 [Blattella germanica]|nr:hypothetical protein C0J52_20714 [Blattella germanica]